MNFEQGCFKVRKLCVRDCSGILFIKGCFHPLIKRYSGKPDPTSRNVCFSIPTRFLKPRRNWQELAGGGERPSDHPGRPKNYMIFPKKTAFIMSLFVPYQNALKLVLSVNTTTFPLPEDCT